MVEHLCRLSSSGLFRRSAQHSVFAKGPALFRQSQAGGLSGMRLATQKAQYARELLRNGPQICDIVVKSEVFKIHISAVYFLGLHNRPPPFLGMAAGMTRLKPPILESLVLPIQQQLHLGGFNARDLADLAWSSARLQLPATIHAIAGEAVRRIAEFKPPELSKMAWACASCKLREGHPFQT